MTAVLFGACSLDKAGAMTNTKGESFIFSSALADIHLTNGRMDFHLYSLATWII